ncbi:MAG: YggS family pyridoxal phosphate enzyme [Acidimicrobiales bacterium]
MAPVEGTVTALAERLAGRLEDVRERLRTAGAEPGRVRIVAVTKGFGPEAVAAAAAAGLTDIGENYAAELLAKTSSFGGAGLCWHFLGAVQRNKVRALAPVVHLWQGVARLVEGEAIAWWAPGSAVLVQVDVTGRPGRQGVAPGAAGELVEALRSLGLDVRGLMAVGPPGPPEGARPGFRLLARLGADLGLAELSMGMTDDLEVAVEEGATMVRIGRALLGARPRPPKLPE